MDRLKILLSAIVAGIFLTGCSLSEIGQTAARAVSFDARIGAGAGYACGSATIAGYGPEICIGIRKPGHVEPGPLEPVPDPAK